MIAQSVTLFSSLLAGAALLAGQAVSLAGGVSWGERPLDAPAAPAAAGEQAGRPGYTWLRERLQDDDERVRQGLLLAVVSVTGLRPVEVLEALEEGNSLEAIAASAGATPQDLLEVYDETAEYFVERAVRQAGLPESLASNLLAWYEEAGRQMLDQPGLVPAYPGLGQLEAALLAAALKVGDLEPGELRAGLNGCQSLEEILAGHGSSAEEAVALAAEKIDERLQELVENGRLSEEQRQDWIESITHVLEELAALPGLRRPACAAD